MEKGLIILLGAGASVDAGMPTVACLTRALRRRLPHLRDVNGCPRPEFGEFFEFVQAHDPSVGENYERFFEWVRLLLEVGREPFRRIIDTKVPCSFVEAIGHLPFVIGAELARLLQSYDTTSDYLARLGDFIPDQGRLKVFSLNYDCCLEDACRAAGINITTGFNPVSKKWDPSLFDGKSTGINLYKLHGSLRWFGTRDDSLPVNLAQHALELMELQPGDLQELPPNIRVSPSPELVAGPGSKIQADDPFLSLFYAFHSSIRSAKACVIIGYSHRDDHVNKVLDQAVDSGVNLLDVNPGHQCLRYIACSRYRHLRQSAKSALGKGDITSEVCKRR